MTSHHLDPGKYVNQWHHSSIVGAVTDHFHRINFALCVDILNARTMDNALGRNALQQSALGLEHTFASVAWRTDNNHLLEKWMINRVEWDPEMSLHRDLLQLLLDLFQQHLQIHMTVLHHDHQWYHRVDLQRYRLRR